MYKNFKPKMKPMIENLKNELYQLENKQAKRTNICAKISAKLKGEKGSKTFFRVLESQNMQIQTEFKIKIFKGHS